MDKNAIYGFVELDHITHKKNKKDKKIHVTFNDNNVAILYLRPEDQRKKLISENKWVFRSLAEEEIIIAGEDFSALKNYSPN